jgi:hypothetical protein
MTIDLLEEDEEQRPGVTVNVALAGAPVIYP